jgi:hypothetical protein
MRDADLFATPDPMSSRRVAVLAAAAMAAVLAHPVLHDVDEVVAHARGPYAWHAVSACTALVAAVHVSFSSRAASDLGVVVRCVLAGLLLGVLDAGLSLGAVVGLETGNPGAAAGAFVMGSIFGSVVGGSRGLLFGMAFIPLVLLAVEHRKRPSHEGRDVALMVGGTSLALAAMLAHLLLPEAAVSHVLVATVGLATAGIGWFGLLRRRRFVADAMRGALPGWAAREESAIEVGSAPLFPASRAGLPDALLCRRHEEGHGPYRSGSVWVPVARIARPPYPASPG